MDPTAAGFTLIALSAGTLGGVLLWLRALPRRGQTSPQETETESIHLGGDQADAVLLVLPGGRAAYLNAPAREWFQAGDETPNLENLARRTVPAQAFLNLCAADGRAHLTIDGRAVEGASYSTPFNGSQARLVVLHRPVWGALDASFDFAQDELGRAERSRSADLASFDSGQRQPAPDAFLSSRHCEEGASPAKESHSTVSQNEIASPRSLAMTDASRAIELLAEMGAAMSAGLGLETALQAILESIERLVPADLIEVSAWDADQQRLVPYQLVLSASGERRLEKGGAFAAAGTSAWLAAQRKPLLVSDMHEFTAAAGLQASARPRFHTYLGLPLLVDAELAGVIELGCAGPGRFRQADLELVSLISAQAALALRNARLYRAEQRRAEELSGLSQLAQAVSAIRDPRDLAARLTEIIAPLLQVEILGFLLYDENRRLLVGQAPFMGIPDNLVEWCRAALPPGSPAEAVWTAGETLVAPQAPNDERLAALGLHHIAQAAGMQACVLQPLVSGGRRLGYLQAADKLDGAPFGPADLRLLEIIAAQAAPLLENAQLVHQSQRRAQRAETLRRIASLTSSTAELDEILKYSLVDLARLLQADFAAIYLLDEQRGELRPHLASLFTTLPEAGKSLPRLAVEDPLFSATATARQAPFSAASLEEPGSPLIDPLALEQGLASRIGAPLIIRDRGTGEILLASREADFFQEGDLISVATTASQMAAAVDRAGLSAQTDQSLRQRLDQLTALTRVSREINSSLDLERLLQRVLSELLGATRSDCGSVLLLETPPLPPGPLLPQGETPLSPTRGERGWGIEGLSRVLLTLGDPPSPAGSALAQAAMQAQEPVLIPDFSLSAPDQPAPHADIRSALVVPILSRGQVAGAISLHSRTPGHYDRDRVEIAETLAIQAAIALNNAQRYREQVQRSEQLHRRVETLSKISETTPALQAGLPLEASLEAIAAAIRSATPFDAVLVSVYEAPSGELKRVAQAGLPAEQMDALRAVTQPWEAVKKLLQPEFRTGQAYLIPFERMPVIPPEVHAVTILRPLEKEPVAGSRWDPEDMLLLPILAEDGRPLGMISVDAPRDGLRPDRATVEALEIFTSQAAIAIQNHARLQAQIRQEEALRLELSQARARLPELQARERAAAEAAEQLSRRSARLQAGLDAWQNLNRQTGRSGILHELGQELLHRLGWDTLFIAEPRRTSAEPHLLHALGRLPEGMHPEALFGQRNPLRYSLQTGARLLVHDLKECPDWQNTPLLSALEAQAFICLPLLRRGQLDSVLMACGQANRPPFTPEDEQLFDLLLGQAANALHNLELKAETQERLREVDLLLEFSRKLGGLDTASILKTLAASALKALPAARGVLVALWEPGKGVLQVKTAEGYPNIERMLEIAFQPGEGLPGLAFQKGEALRVDEVDFARDYNLGAANQLRYRDATAGRSPVSSLAIPIARSLGKEAASSTDRLAPRQPLGVIVLDHFEFPGAFDAEGQALVASLARQTALTLENARLYQAAEQRAHQMETLAEVAATITSSLEPDALIDSLLDQLQEILPYDTGALWLRTGDSLDSGRRRPAQGASFDYAQDADSGILSAARKPEVEETADSQVAGHLKMSVRAARGFADSEQRVGITTAVEDSRLLSEMITTSRPVYVPNVLEDARFPALLEPSCLTWLGLPLLASGGVVGVIALEKTEPGFYTPEQIQAAAAFAAQAAVALENASMYQESVRRTRELDQQSHNLMMLNRLSTELSGSLDAGHILSFSLADLQRLLGCSQVSALLFDQAGAARVEAEYRISDGQREDATPSPSIPQPLSPIKGERGESPFSRMDDIHGRRGPGGGGGETLPGNPLFERLRQSLGIFQAEDIAQEPDLQPLAEFLQHRQAHSLLVLPLAAGKEALGLLLAASQEPRRFSAEEIELARTIANQTAIAVQNAHLFAETRSLTEDLEQRVEQRTAELGREHQRSQALLRVITELSASLDLEQILTRTLGVINEMASAEQATVLIIRTGERRLYRVASVGYTRPAGVTGSLTPFDQHEGLAGWVIQNRRSTLVSDLRQDPRWVAQPEPYPDEHRSALVAPLMVGPEVLGCLLLFHRTPDHFNPDQLELIQAVANQMAVAVNNAELFRLIRDQAEDMGAILRKQQVETSRSKAILEAVADGVLVTDHTGRVTLFNASAEDILGLSRTSVVSKSLDYFSGLFGSAAQPWLETIRAWSQDPRSYRPGDSYREQINLENGSVVSVRLAPVILRSDFLGTVSIFTDVTHQVEVDRLKSEFVSTVSHELRTPMTSIKGYVEILLMGAAGPLSDQQKRFLGTVKINTERLTVLVNDLLDISRIEAGKVRLSLQPLNLRQIAEAATADLLHRSQEEKKPIQVRMDIPENLPPVVGDVDRIRQIFDNLLDNAYQYNAPNGEIRVTMHPYPDHIQVDVTDTGIGIPLKEQGRVFERFFRGEGPLVMGVSGTGLGLSIVQTIIHMHHGLIWLKSSGIPGEGSTFSFTLPAYRPKP